MAPCSEFVTRCADLHYFAFSALNLPVHLPPVTVSGAVTMNRNQPKAIVDHPWRSLLLSSLHILNFYSSSLIAGLLASSHHVVENVFPVCEQETTGSKSSAGGSDEHWSVCQV